jgi:phage gp36-like protein
LEAYFGAEELLIAADRDGDGVADTGVIDAALLAATSEIDSYLAVQYDLPLPHVPEVLTRVCSDLAMYHMCIGHASMTEDKETRYESGIKWLRDLAKGLVALGLIDAEEEATGAQNDVEITSTSDDRLFTRSSMRRLT